MIDRETVLRALNVSHETSERLDAYVALLRRWQQRINLVSPATLDVLWMRHILDSAQLLSLARPTAHHWVDLGSGAGFPGLIIALLLKERADSHVSLIESSGKKCAFLTEAIRITDAPAKVFHGRIADVLAGKNAPKADVVTARALAPLPNLLSLAAPLLIKGAEGIFPKGQDVEAELTEASKSWRIDVELLPSITDPNGRIIRVTALAPRLPN